MLASDPALPDLALRAPDVRALARRAALPAVAVAVVAAVVLVAGAQSHVLADAARRLLHMNPGWAAIAVLCEGISIAGYVGVLWLVAGRAAPRVGPRESAQITLTGAAATRLLPTAGAGGAAMTVWALRRAGLSSTAATRTLLAFFVVLYAAFLAAVAVFGALLTLGVTHSHGPIAMSAAASVLALVGIGACLLLGLASPASTDGPAPGSARLRRGAHVVGLAVRDALRLVRSRDLRLAGAVAYWASDAAVLWAMLRMLGAAPPLPVLGLAYFLGQVANTVPLPGSVSGGMTGVLIAWGVSAPVALPAVLAYRTIAVWLPTPGAIAAVPGLRTTVGRWADEDAGQDSVAAAGSSFTAHRPEPA